MELKRTSVIVMLCAFLAACGGQQTAAPAATTEATAAATAAPATTAETTAVSESGAGGNLVVMTHDSFNVSEDVLNAFTQETGIKVEILKSGDAGSALNKAILSKNAPLADMLFGVDNTFFSRAINADLFDPYDSPALATVPADLKLDPENRLVPIDYGYVSLNYDKAFLQQNNLAVPQDLRDLTKPEWKGKLVVENPATSSPGLAFLLATISQFGSDGSYTWKQYWQDLRANDVLVSESWDDAYYTQFSGSSGKGPRPLVVSYASSPPAEVYFSEQKLDDAPTGVVTAGSFRQIEFAGILKGAKNRAQAEKFIDFMLSKPFQEDMPLQMFVYPVQPDAQLPDVFTKYAEVPQQPLSLDPVQIEQNRESWIQDWTTIVQR